MFYAFFWKTLEISDFGKLRMMIKNTKDTSYILLMLLFFNSEVVPLGGNCLVAAMASMGSRLFKVTSFGPLSDLFRA